MYTGILFSYLKKEWNNAICSSNMDGPRDHHIKWSKSGRATIWYHLHIKSKIGHIWTYLWNRNRLWDTENRPVAVAVGGSEAEGWTGSLALADTNYIYRMDKQQGPTI